MPAKPDPRSRLYTGYVASLRCERETDLPECLIPCSRRLRTGITRQDFFHTSLARNCWVSGSAPGDWPHAHILLFEHCQRLDSAGVARWLSGREAMSEEPAGVANLHANVDESAFDVAIRKIRAYIESGDTYQVNYTYRLRADVFGSPVKLCRLRERQPVPYGALMALPDGRSVLSYSPELFLRHENGKLTARPMKGTAPASGDPEMDARRARMLSEDEKNRAENLMIVDLLRNDLGRIAQSGSVQVPALFEVNAFGAVLQMTSTVTASVAQRSVADGSVQRGLSVRIHYWRAEKHTMEIIREVEPAARGLYTGAIGWFDLPESTQAVPNFCLSVPIRTLMLEAPDANGIRREKLVWGRGSCSTARHKKSTRNAS